jgi:hypothetical protein
VEAVVDAAEEDGELGLVGGVEGLEVEGDAVVVVVGDEASIWSTM